MTAEASEPEKQLIQYFLNKPLLTGLELQKVCSTIFGSMWKWNKYYLIPSILIMHSI